jgi:hypothetical protein
MICARASLTLAGLNGPHAGIDATKFNQCLMRAIFSDLPLLKHENSNCISDR